MVPYTVARTSALLPLRKKTPCVTSLLSRSSRWPENSILCPGGLPGASFSWLRTLTMLALKVTAASEQERFPVGELMSQVQ